MKPASSPYNFRDEKVNNRFHPTFKKQLNKG